MSAFRPYTGLLLALALAVGLYYSYSTFIAPGDGAGSGSSAERGGFGGGRVQPVLVQPVRQETFADR